MRSNERLQLSRLLSRPSDPPLNPTQASARIASQMPLSTKTSYATAIIDNSGSLGDLTAQVDRLVAKWRAQQGEDSGWWWRACWLVPPLGLAAGGLCLVGRWWRGRRGGRRRGRGEVERRRDEQVDRRGQGESIALKDMGRARAGGSMVRDGPDRII